MKKLITCLFLSTFLYSQNPIKINYTVFPTGGSLENNPDVLNSKVKSSFIGVDEELKRLDYELLINGQISYFHLLSSLNLDNKPSRLAKSFAGNGEYYINSEKNQVTKVIDFMGEKFNISLESSNEWTLSKETKMINNYLCFKATKYKALNLKEQDNVLNIIAWYCPSLPYKFGPKEFWNLPGLIMELQDDKITYVVSKIQIEDNPSWKFIPFKGKLINESDFYKIVKETREKTILTLSKE